MILLAAALAQGMTAAHVDRCAGLQIGQPKVHAPIAAVGRAEQREERLILVDGQQLPVAQRPAFRGEAERHDANFREKRFSHIFVSLLLSGFSETYKPLTIKQAEHFCKSIIRCRALVKSGEEIFCHRGTEPQRFFKAVFDSSSAPLCLCGKTLSKCNCHQKPKRRWERAEVRVRSNQIITDFPA